MSLKPTHLEPLPREFYSRDPLEVAPGLIGTRLVHLHPERGLLCARIVEVEAYRGTDDLACHAAKGLTPRTRIMYGAPGHAYVYLIYGMYDMLNVVTWPEGRPAAVLIRAAEPLWGVEARTDGPGRLCRAMGVRKTLHNGIDLTDSPLFIAPAEREVLPSEVQTSPRIGIDYAGEWADRAWRWTLEASHHTSRRR